MFPTTFPTSKWYMWFHIMAWHQNESCLYQHIVLTTSWLLAQLFTESDLFFQVSHSFFSKSYPFPLWQLTKRLSPNSARKTFLRTVQQSRLILTINLAILYTLHFWSPLRLISTISLFFTVDLMNSFASFALCFYVLSLSLLPYFPLFWNCYNFH